MGFLGFGKPKRTEAELRRSAAAKEKLAQLRDSGSMPTVARLSGKDLAAQNIADATERAKAARVAQTARESFNYVAADKSLTVTAPIHAQVFDASAVPLKGQPTKKALIVLGNDFFLVAGQDPATVQAAVQASQTITPAIKIAAEQGAKIQARSAQISGNGAVNGHAPEPTAE